MKLTTVSLLLLAFTANAQNRAAIPYLWVPTDSVLVGLDAVKFRFMLSGQSSIDTTSVRTHAEMRLRRAGLRVDSLATPILELSCVTAGNATVSAWNCAVRQRNVVDLYTPRRGIYLPIVWETRPRVEAVGTPALSGTFSKTIDTVIDEFLNAWLKANPRK